VERAPRPAAARVDRMVLVPSACNFEDTEAMLAQAAEFE
jgi:hypothetical protein